MKGIEINISDNGPTRIKYIIWAWYSILVTWYSTHTYNQFSHCKWADFVFVFISFTYSIGPYNWFICTRCYTKMHVRKSIPNTVKSLESRQWGIGAMSTTPQRALIQCFRFSFIVIRHGFYFLHTKIYIFINRCSNLYGRYEKAVEKWKISVFIG